MIPLNPGGPRPVEGNEIAADVPPGATRVRIISRIYAPEDSGRAMAMPTAPGERAEMVAGHALRFRVEFDVPAG